MAIVTGLAIFAMLAVCIVTIIIMEHQTRDIYARIAESQRLHTEAMAKWGTPADIITATGKAIHGPLALQAAESMANASYGMDTLGLDESTGQEGAMFPDVEYDPFQDFDFASGDAPEPITEPSEISVNGDGE